MSLLGKGTLAVRIGQWFLESPGFELEHVVPVIPEPAWTDSLKAWAERARVPVTASGDYRELPDFASGGELDLVFSCFYDKIIKADFIDRCDRILNLHNGPLPKYRGVSPINWALKNEEDAHGVTIHEITPGIDDGAIVSQVTYSIYPDVDEVEDVYRRALEFGWTLFAQTMPMLGRIASRPQDDAQMSYYSAKENSLLGDRGSFRRELAAEGA